MIRSIYFRICATAITLMAMGEKIYARAGGGGGRSHSSGGSYHSSGGSYHSSGGYPVGGYGGGGGGIGMMGLIILVLIAIVIFYFIKSRLGSNLAGTPGVDVPGEPLTGAPQDISFPDGLDRQKVQTAFLSIQTAWQNKDLKPVRKWISDGVYQRYTAQFAIMNQLGQTNRLGNIRLYDISPIRLSADGSYQVVDVAVSFRMDDEFVSDKYPQFNEQYEDDEDTEYWTFIRRLDAKGGKDLYNNNSCPNCGAPLEIALGEISRCGHCGTLTNSAVYDWVLSEITQGDDYNGRSVTADEELQKLTANDNLFAIQRMEDIASNTFMQIMEVMAGGAARRLGRFADKATAADIEAKIKSRGTYIFDRLYLNDVTLAGYSTENNMLSLFFDLQASYKRVQVAGDRLKLIDEDVTIKNFKLTLSKNLDALRTPAKETVYSYECPNCGAPYTDTTDEVCTYCGEPVINPARNWVLTAFEFPQ